MFTGLIEDIGTILGVARRGAGREFTIRTAIPLAEVAIGDSIAVDGACLTAESLCSDRFVAVAGRETLEKTTLAAVTAGASVHLERALRLGDRLGGHIVQGHVDGVGRVVRVEADRESLVLWVESPPSLTRYIAAKGSICVDGVSLTVNEVQGGRFRVNVVPHTAQVTRLGGFVSGRPVNLEVDILAKYVERLLRPLDGEGLTLDKLARYGFGPSGG